MDLDRIEGHDVGVDGLLQDGACIGGGGCHPGRGALVLTARGGVAVGGAHDDQIPEPWVHGPARLRGAQRGRGLGSERCVEPGAMTQTASKRRRQGIREGMESRGKRGKGRVSWAGSCLREPGGGRLADWQTRELHAARWTDAMAHGRRVMPGPGPGQPVRAGSGTHSAR